MEVWGLQFLVSSLPLQTGRYKWLDRNECERIYLYILYLCWISPLQSFLLPEICKEDIIGHCSLIILVYLIIKNTHAVLFQAMQYTSPKAIWNLLFGVDQPSFEPNKGTDTCPVKYPKAALCFSFSLIAFFFSIFFFFRGFI